MKGLAAFGDYVYVTDSLTHSLYVVDVSNPATMVIAGFISSSTQLFKVRAPASHARVATQPLPLMPCTVVPVHMRAGGQCCRSWQLRVSSQQGGRFFDRGGHIVSLVALYCWVHLVIHPIGRGARASIPRTCGPRLLPLMPCTVCLCTCTQPRSVAVRGNYALVASSEGASLTVVDISSPSSPVIVGFISSSTQLDKVRARHPTHVQPLVPVWPRPDHRASAHACRPKESLWPAAIMQSSSVVALNP